MKINEIRNLLRECENSLIFAILERSRWKSNDRAYLMGQKSLFTRMLVGTEFLHEKLGRYNCPEEHPFTEIMLETTVFITEYKIDSFLDHRHLSININKSILEDYFKKILPKITDPGEDENVGSAVTADINLLQILSRRIHLGKLVAQIKYNEDPEWYGQPHTEKEIIEKLTNSEIEDLYNES